MNLPTRPRPTARPARPTRPPRSPITTCGPTTGSACAPTASAASATTCRARTARPRSAAAVPRRANARSSRSTGAARRCPSRSPSLRRWPSRRAAADRQGRARSRAGRSRLVARGHRGVGRQLARAGRRRVHARRRQRRSLHQGALPEPDRAQAQLEPVGEHRRRSISTTRAPIATRWIARTSSCTADGLIVVGYRYTDSAGGKGRTANKFFTKAPVPLH